MEAGAGTGAGAGAGDGEVEETGQVGVSWEICIDFFSDFDRI